MAISQKREIIEPLPEPPPELPERKKPIAFLTFKKAVIKVPIIPRKTKATLVKNKAKDITEEGVHFKSHIDGSKLFLTPEKSIEIQNKLDSDIAMSFDECPPFPVTYEYMKASVERTLRWAARGKKVHNNPNQALFGIVQGGEFEDLREYSCKETVKMDFDGYSIGGTSVGEDKETMYKMIDYGVKYLPEDKVRYLMGGGDPIDIIEGVIRGIDIFDCVLPTRIARHGQAFTRTGKINFNNAKFKALLINFFFTIPIKSSPFIHKSLSE